MSKEHNEDQNKVKSYLDTHIYKIMKSTNYTTVRRKPILEEILVLKARKK